MLSPLRTVTRPLPRVLILHTGGTLGMDPTASFECEEAPNGSVSTPGAVKARTPRYLGVSTGGGGAGLAPSTMLANVLGVVPELQRFSNVDLQVVTNRDSSRVGPGEWVDIARILHANRLHYDAFMVIHGTDTMAYTAAALSLMLRGFNKPVVMTGSQLPLTAPRTDARQNLLDAIQCATAPFAPGAQRAELREVAVCFGGRLLRGNRAQKVHTSSYQAFDSPGYPHLAQLGIDVEWNERALLRPEGGYRPRFKLHPGVMRVPVVPGCDPRTVYGDVAARGVRGVVLEVFGTGNLPDTDDFGWVPWLRQQTEAGVHVAVVSQCSAGALQPALYASGGWLAQLGERVEAAPRMTPECAAVKLMLCCAHPGLGVGEPIAGEL